MRPGFSRGHMLRRVVSPDVSSAQLMKKDLLAAAGPRLPRPPPRHTAAPGEPRY